jgi:hypothetical protein
VDEPKAGEEYGAGDEGAEGGREREGEGEKMRWARRAGRAAMGVEGREEGPASADFVNYAGPAGQRIDL